MDENVNDNGNDDDDDEAGGEGYGLACPFWIDTGAYTPRDQFMFVCGTEFEAVIRQLMENDGPHETVIHRENESRVRMAAGRFGRRVVISACEPEHDPAGTWSYLRIEPGRG